MTLEALNDNIARQIATCLLLLEEKGREYVFNEDRLQHFKEAGEALGVSPEQALWGMASKHFTSLGQMCKAEKEFSDAVWDEKITDAINYLLLLKCLVQEGADD